MATIGEQLRAAREAKRLQLEDAHRQTKIHTRILQAMEEDRAGEILAPAYAKVFLKKYATFLNLDPVPLVAEYLRAEPPSPSSLTIQGNGSPEGAAAVEGPRWMPAIIAVAAVIGMGFLVVLAKDLYRTVTTTPAPPHSVGGQAPGAAAPKPAAPAAPAPKPIVPKSQPLTLSVKAAQDCWMQVKADDKVLFQNILGKGRQETWTAHDALELWVGNAAALTLTLNGHALEPLEPGVLKGVKVTRYGLQLPKKSR